MNFNHNSIKLDHIGYAVRSTDEAIDAFRFNYPDVLAYKKHVESQNVYITFLSNEKVDYKIELVQGVDDPNPISKVLNSEEVALYHLGYLTNNFEESLQYYKQNGFYLATKPFICSVDKQYQACHLYNEYTGIIELMMEMK